MQTTPGIRFTSRAEREFDPAFKQRILKVYSRFPELGSRPVICGSISRGSRYLGTACGWTYPQKVSLQPGVGNTTIAHEFTHLVQGNGIPHGEKQCDIWTVARLDLELLDEKPHYILRGWKKDRWVRNKAAVRQLCIQSIKERDVRRNYIVWLSQEFRKMK